MPETLGDSLYIVTLVKNCLVIHVMYENTKHDYPKIDVRYQDLTGGQVLEMKSDKDFDIVIEAMRKRNKSKKTVK